MFAMTQCKNFAPNGYGVVIFRWLIGNIERRLDSSLNNLSAINRTLILKKKFFFHSESLIIVRFKPHLERDSVMTELNFTRGSSLIGLLKKTKGLRAK